MINLFLLCIGIFIVGIAGIAESIMDKLIYHYDESIFKKFKNQQYWDPNKSWVNKYKKDLVSPRFFGSTTIFVFSTDAWHLFKFLRTLLLFIGLIIIGFNSLSVFYVIGFTIIARILFGILFQYFFKKIFSI